MSDYKYRKGRELPPVESEAYTGPERRSGKHSPYGDGLFSLLRLVAERQVDISERLAVIEALLEAAHD